MRPRLTARCPVCGSPITVPFVLLGTQQRCPSCSEIVIPQVPVGTAYPKTEYEMTFGDLKLLLTTADYRPTLAGLLFKWYSYTLVSVGNDTSVRSPEGEQVDLEQLHLRIQNDPAKQRELYSAAMALWT